MRIKDIVRNLLPRPILGAYHVSLAYLGAIWYRSPSREMIVIGVTGTDGKSSTIEYINAIFEAAGRRTAMLNSIRVKVDMDSEPSTGRSMPGRFFIQRFLRRALDENCAVAIIEMTSEGVKQSRHRCIALDCLVFTNLTPEHIESHGSFEAYADAKFEIGRALVRSPKRTRIIVANAEDREGQRYLALPVEKKYGFSLADHKPYASDARGGSFTFAGRTIHVHMPGEFYLRNALAAAKAAHALGIGIDAIEQGIAGVTHIPGRLQRIECGQDFTVIVDYALTPDAMEKLYKTFHEQKKICVFGCTGGGRDKWKRPVIGALAERECDTVILTNDIAYGEDPAQIISDIARGMQEKPEIIMDRRAAIRRAFQIAQDTDRTEDNQSGTAVLITGMGIDTEITDAGGNTTEWSDVEIAREELLKLGYGS